ncbi:DUF6777 domain-containing protein [Streptomyces thermocarboxydovorans]|uniref:DUF6777 domain-containing protein n=1 Tax=Streptomyces thermocarboxydovorans TaxID=59298 RepID=UPI0031DCF4B1
MSVEPPDSGRPTGPPSGPLPGRSEPPSSDPPSQPPPSGPSSQQPSSGPPSEPPSSGPPSQPPGAGGGDGSAAGGGGEGPREPGRRPWWKSVAGISVVAVAVVAAVILAVVLGRSDGGTEAGGGGGGEVFLQAADSPGRDPFTESTAEDSAPPTATPSAPTASATPGGVRVVEGGRPGLYGGTRNNAACDVEQQIKYLQDVPAKNEAFASVLDLEPSRVPDHLRSLTPLQLRMDTRVTNHGYRDGAAIPYQAVLQAGTAVLVDDRGVPRVRCACGNPLTEPVEQSDPRYTGDRWPGYDPAKVVVVEPAPEPVEKFVVYDPEKDSWFERERGDKGKADKPTRPPGKPSPSDGTGTPSTEGTGEESGCPPGEQCPSGSPSPSAPDSEPGTGESPTDEAPSEEVPTEEGGEDGDSSAPGSSQPPPQGSDTAPEPGTDEAPPPSS